MQIQNRTIFNKDNLDVLQGMNSDSIDLIYLDPPFNTKREFTATIGSSAEGASFKDWFLEQDIKDEWVQSIEQDNPKLHDFLTGIKQIDGKQSYNYCYIAYMAIRLLECHRILKNTGSVYLHCDPTMSHYLKITLDCIFGNKNFRNEIVWCYHGPGSPKMRQFNRKTDAIFWYSKGNTWTFNSDKCRVPYKDPNQSLRKRMSLDGDFTQDDIMEYREKGKLLENWWIIRIAPRSKKEYTGYPTQKPLELLRRIITASSNAGDIVLDPFCGCATTCVAAEQLGRKWIGIDISVKAYELVKQRLEKDVSDETDIFKKDNAVHFKTDAPIRTDMGADTRIQKYVYIISNPAYHTDYKVGIAKDATVRLNSYQTSDPERGYALEHTILTPYFTELEKHIHERFPNKYEWIQDTDINAIKTEMNSFLANKE